MLPDTPDATAFAQRMDNGAGLRERASSFALFAFAAAAQFAACNRLHALEARYARWLLMASDRLGADEFAVTQEYTSQMLGVRRAGVTEDRGGSPGRPSTRSLRRKPHGDELTRVARIDELTQIYVVPERARPSELFRHNSR